MKHFNDNDNLIHFNSDDEWDCDHHCGCDGDCESCEDAFCQIEMPPFDAIIHILASMRLDMLYRNAYDIGLMSKADYIDMLGHSLAEYHVDGEDDAD